MKAWMLGGAALGAGLAYLMRQGCRLKQFATPKGNKGGIVISGAATGVGRHAAETLASLGFTVFAGVRRLDAAEHVTALRSAGCVPLQLDVTDESSVAAAALLVESTLTAAGLPLVALCNNAALDAPPEVVELEDPVRARRLLDVNCVSLFNMHRHFVPLLRASAGVGGCARIVNTGSVAGWVAPAGGALFAMSKPSSWARMPSTLSDDTAAAARLVPPRVRAAPRRFVP